MDNSHSSSVDGSSLISDGHGLIWSVLSSAFRKTPAFINEDPPRPIIPIKKSCWTFLFMNSGDMSFTYHEQQKNAVHRPKILEKAAWDL